MTRARTLVAVALVAVVAACGQPGVLDVDRTEERVADELTATYGVPFGAVACPDEVQVEEGASFGCTATVGEGEAVEVTVVQTDGEGALEVAADRAVISTPEVEADIVVTLADRFSRDDVEVTCDGPEVRVEEPDATFTCAAVDGDEERTVEVLVRDARGALTYTLD